MKSMFEITGGIIITGLITGRVLFLFSGLIYVVTGKAKDYLSKRTTGSKLRHSLLSTKA